MRPLPTPAHIRKCGCGADSVYHLVGPYSERYICAVCGELVADFAFT